MYEVGKSVKILILFIRKVRAYVIKFNFAKHFNGAKPESLIIHLSPIMTHHINHTR